MHPDKCADANAGEAFKRLNAAYESLAQHCRRPKPAGAGASGDGGGKGAGARPQSADEKWGIPKKKKQQQQKQPQQQRDSADSSKWWQHASCKFALPFAINGQYMCSSFRN